MRDALVRVHDGRIVAISKAGDASAQSSRDTIAMDGSGLFLAPGLIDSHAVNSCWARANQVAESPPSP
jgi:predicted amidohydrolase YtcJ